MRKSRFLTLMFSIIPGVGHMYLGLVGRGAAILVGFLAWSFVSIFGIYGIRGGSYWSGGVLPALLLAPLPVIWLFGVFDAFNECNRINYWAGASATAAHEAENPGSNPQAPGPFAAPTGTANAAPTVPESAVPAALSAVMPERPAAFWLVLCSLIPGAGHMYLGWQRRGLELMSMFFAAVYLTYSLNLNLFLFTLPVIWFYSFFDALQLSSAKPAPQQEPHSWWFSWNQRYVGYGCVAIGSVILFDRIVSPLVSFDYRIIHMMRSGIVVALFIGGGLRLILGKPIKRPGSATPADAEIQSPDEEVEPR